MRHEWHRHQFFYLLGRVYFLSDDEQHDHWQHYSQYSGWTVSPITEIFNPNVDFGGGDHDIIISSVVATGTNGILRTDDISSGAIPGTLSGTTYSGGTSGIIWDNTSTQVQASSVYFSTLGTNVNTGGCNGNIHCAVKLTQKGLQ